MKTQRFTDLPLRFHYDIDTTKKCTYVQVIRRDTNEIIHEMMLPRVFTKDELESMTKDIVSDLAQSLQGKVKRR